jgi:hypothetical protein
MRHLIIFCIALQSFSIYAQQGLQGIYVEPYYVTSTADQQDSLRSGPLETGSVVYRIYADLEPGYRFQAAYGSPDHALEIWSDRNFFNHNHSGNSQPNVIPERDLAKNITLIDSWLTAGAASENHLGIPRKDDMILQDSYLRFQNGFLANTLERSENEMGPLTMPLSQCDGLVRVETIPSTTFYMLDSAAWALHSVTRSNRIYIDNGAWACMGKGTAGADSTSGNHVLIAQLTTAGAIHYKLNLMIGTPDGKSIRYVHSNPVDGEILHPSLTGSYIWRRDKKETSAKRAKSK